MLGPTDELDRRTRRCRLSRSRWRATSKPATRAHFVVRQLSLPSTAASAESIEFEYYDVDGDARTPVVVLLPVFNGQLEIPRFFARYFANQGWAAVVVTRGRDPLARSDRARRRRCEATCRIIAACSTGSSASPSSTRRESACSA